MDLLLVLTYTALCVAIFKLFRIPINKWSVPTAALGGVVLIGTLIFLMNYNHPYSEMGRQYFISTPIIPAVSGIVIDVPVDCIQNLKKDDILFQLDPVPFQNKLASIQAQLIMAQSDLARANELVAKKAMPERDRDLAKARVDQLTADEASLKFELEQTTVRAPSDGNCTQLAIRPGMMASNLPFRPLMIFLHKQENYYVGWFRQNSLLRLQKGDSAEVTFDGIPGVIFQGKVSKVFEEMAEGQVTASGNLIDIKQSSTPGRIPVIIEIDDPNFLKYKETLPGGAFGQTAIYSSHFHHVAIMRKILLRMDSWLNYLFPFH
jgi:multidrug resistance efflux pump